MYHKMLFFQIQKGKNFVKIQCGTKLDRLFFNSRKEPDMTRLYAFLKKSPLENNRKILIAALCLLVIAGMVPRIYGLIRLPHEFFHNDGNEYRDISEQLYKGNGFSVTSYRWYEAVPPDRTSDLHTDFSRPPLLPLLGAGLYFLPFDWTVSAKVTTVLLSVICILMTFLLGKEIFSSSTVGFLAAAIYTFYPYSIYHSLCWSSENLFLIFLCASYLFLCRCIRRSFAWKYAALCGAMLALASGFLGSVAYWQIKELGQLKEPSWRIVFYFTVFGTFYGLLGNLFLEGGLSPITSDNIGYLIGMAVCATCAQCSLTLAFGQGNVLLSSCLQFSAIIMAELMGLLFFGDALSLTTEIGIAVIMVSGVCATMLTRRQQTKP